MQSRKWCHEQVARSLLVTTLQMQYSCGAKYGYWPCNAEHHNYRLTSTRSTDGGVDIGAAEAPHKFATILIHAVLAQMRTTGLCWRALQRLLSYRTHQLLNASASWEEGIRMSNNVAPGNVADWLHEWVHFVHFPYCAAGRAVSNADSTSQWQPRLYEAVPPFQTRSICILYFVASRQLTGCTAASTVGRRPQR